MLCRYFEGFKRERETKTLRRRQYQKMKVIENKIT